MHQNSSPLDMPAKCIIPNYVNNYFRNKKNDSQDQSLIEKLLLSSEYPIINQDINDVRYKSLSLSDLNAVELVLFDENAFNFSQYDIKKNKIKENNTPSWISLIQSYSINLLLNSNLSVEQALLAIAMLSDKADLLADNKIDIEQLNAFYNELTFLIEKGTFHQYFDNFEPQTKLQHTLLTSIQELLTSNLLNKISNNVYNESIKLSEGNKIDADALNQSWFSCQHLTLMANENIFKKYVFYFLYHYHFPLYDNLRPSESFKILAINYLWLKNHLAANNKNKILNKNSITQCFYVYHCAQQNTNNFAQNCQKLLMGLGINDASSTVGLIKSIAQDISFSDVVLSKIKTNNVNCYHFHEELNDTEYLAVFPTDNSNVSFKSFSWKQTKGSINLLTDAQNNNILLLFTAPKLTVDEVYEFEFQAIDENNVQYISNISFNVVSHELEIYIDHATLGMLNQLLDIIKNRKEKPKSDRFVAWSRLALSQKNQDALNIRSFSINGTYVSKEMLQAIIEYAQNHNRLNVKIWTMNTQSAVYLAPILQTFSFFPHVNITQITLYEDGAAEYVNLYQFRDRCSNALLTEGVNILNQYMAREMDEEDVDRKSVV